MFELVDRVEDYPRFLPWCTRGEVIERSETLTVASVHVGLFGISSGFSTSNAKRAPYSMDLRLRSGLFRQLAGSWRFTPLGESGCKVELSLRYEFSSFLLERTLGAVFAQVTSSLVDSFVKRAHEIYK